MSKIEIRPQPLGIFPAPAGDLLLPVASDELMQGKIPSDFSAELKFYQAALDEDVDAAIEHLANQTGEVADYNRFALRPTSVEYQILKARFSGELLTLLDLTAFTHHLTNEPPDANDLDGELFAVVMLAHAGRAIENYDVEGAIKIFDQTLAQTEKDSPVLAAHIMATKADVLATNEAPKAVVIQLYSQALKTFNQTDLHFTAAEIALNLGVLHQDTSRGQRASLLEAVRAYQEALKFFRRETHAEQFAFCQNNLALAYLAMPLTEASDQLRVGIAVQALREVLKVWTKETHLDQWASVQMNLANALQYLPSTHPQENLAEAVELYEEALTARNPDNNSLTRARLLANQGNALAHLGIFNHAVPKLVEASQIFARNNESESADSVMEVLAEIRQIQAGKTVAKSSHGNGSGN